MNQDDKEKVPRVEKDGFTAEELGEQAANEDSEDILRKMLREEETGAEADDKDIADSHEKIDESDD